MNTKMPSPNTILQIIGCAILLLLGSGCAVSKGAKQWFGNNSWSASPSFSPETIEKVAVFAEDNSGWGRNRGANPSLARTVEDQFIQALMKRGYRVAERSEGEKLRREIEQQAGPLNEAQTIALGKHINASALVIVTINSATVTRETAEFVDEKGRRFRENYWMAHATVGARMSGVETGEVLGAGSHTANVTTSSQSDPLPAITRAADVIASSIPKRVVVKVE